MIEVRETNNEYDKYEDADVIELDKQATNEDFVVTVDEQPQCINNMSLDQIADEAAQDCTESEDDLASEIMGKY